MKIQEGLQDASLESKICPKCISEPLIRTMGNLLCCPNCDIVLLDERHTSEGTDSL